jgi:hypothetical protein
VLLHLFGYQFAPRYCDFYEQIRTSLYGFKHPRQYTTGVLRPVRKINTGLIIEDWDNIQRIMVSLALKTTTQSIIVSKLSTYARKNKTRQALWEYDNIIRSLYLLKYLDSSHLRQQVQRALSRSENYHQLRRAVAYANFGNSAFGPNTNSTCGANVVASSPTASSFTMPVSYQICWRSKKHPGMRKGSPCLRTCHQSPGNISTGTAATNFVNHSSPSTCTPSSKRSRRFRFLTTSLADP